MMGSPGGLSRTEVGCLELSEQMSIRRRAPHAYRVGEEVSYLPS